MRLQEVNNDFNNLNDDKKPPRSRSFIFEKFKHDYSGLEGSDIEEEETGAADGEEDGS